MADKVRIAFLGLGRWSARLAEASKQSDRIEIVACHSRSEEKRTAFANQFGGAPKKTYQELLEDENVDAVVLVTPNTLHAPQAIEAAKMGKHVFVEKPMALSVADCYRMIETARKAEVVLFVGQKERRLPRMRKAKEMIDKGAVGEILLAEANHSNDRALQYTPEMWQWYRAESPGGPLTSYTVHHADNLLFLVGAVKKLSALTSKFRGPSEIDDVAAAVMEFESGALGYIGGACLTPFRKWLQIHGIEGTLLVDQVDGGVYYQKKGTLVPEKQGDFPGENEQRMMACAEEMDEFAMCIQEGKQPETGGKEGLAAWAIMEALVRSAESGGMPVEIKDVM